MGPKKKTTAHNANNDEEDPSSSINATLLELVSSLTQVLTSNASLQQEIRTLNANYLSLQNEHKELLKRVESLEQRSGDWSNPAGTRHHATTNDLEALTCTVADELEARKEKVSNVVIYGLAELPPDGDQQPSEDDEKTAVTDLLKDDLTIAQPTVVRAYRMGRPRTDGKPRPLKVHLPDASHKRTVLENAKKLGKLPDHHAHKKVFIRADWTAMQREQDYKRRQELRQRNSDNNSQQPDSNSRNTRQSQNSRT